MTHPGHPFNSCLLSEQQVEALAVVENLRPAAHTPHLTHTEADLLEEINLGFPSDWWEQYEALKAKRRAETLTSTEHARLIEMSDQVENANARRMRYLVELARIRGASLQSLMQELGIQAPDYVCPQRTAPPRKEVAQRAGNRCEYSLRVERLHLNREGVLNLRVVLRPLKEHPPTNLFAD